MTVFPYRLFHAKFDRLLKRIPLIGKILSSIFGIFEILMLEIFRFLDNKFNISTINIVNRYIFKKRWGGKVVPLNVNFDVDTKFLPSQEILELLSRSKVVGIGNCYCRETQRKHSDEPNCDHPIKTCIHIGFGSSLHEIPHNWKKLQRKKSNSF